jgi:transposase
MKKTENTKGEIESSNPLETAPQPVNPPNPEAQDKGPRRRFTAEYKLQILNELDRCKTGAEKGAVIRREGLFSSCISDWRKLRKTGALSALNRIRGRKIKANPKEKQIKGLQDQVARLEKQLIQAKAIIDIQKKVSEIFGGMPQISQNSEQES